MEDGKKRWTTAWCLGGFNVVAFPLVSWGCERFSSAMLNFSDFINVSELLDISLEKGFFT